MEAGIAGTQKTRAAKGATVTLPVWVPLASAAAIAALLLVLLAVCAGWGAVRVSQGRAAAPEAPQAQAAAKGGAPAVEAHYRLVEVGDTLYGIALEEGVPMAEILGANPQIEDADVIFAGTRIQVPAHGA